MSTADTAGHEIKLRYQRVASLRSVQRALYPIRPLPGRLPAEATLKETRERLKQIQPDPRSADAEVERLSPEDRAEEIRQIDRLIDEAAGELRSLAQGLNFSELRAALPGVRKSKPHEVQALLDLFLVDEEMAIGALSIVEYVATLLATDDSGAQRVLAADPVSATPRLREVCEAVAVPDPAVIRSHVQAFEEAILEVARTDAMEPLILRMRQRKAEIGRLLLVPDLFRKAVEYNLTISNRLDDLLEAERTLALLDLETATAEESAPPAGETATSGKASEERERAAIREIGATLADRVQRRPVTGPAAPLVEALDLSLLNGKERQVLGSGELEPDGELQRSVIILGLLSRSGEESDAPLSDLGLPRGRITGHWVPALDTALQKAIADQLRENAYAEAKALSQLRSKHLYRVIEAERNAVAAPTRPAPIRKTEPSTPAGPVKPMPEASRRASRRRSRKATLRAPGRARRWVRRVAIGVGLGAAAVAAAFHFQAGNDARSAHLLSPADLTALSSYLDSAYRDGHGHGPTFFGTLNPKWNGLSPRAQREEAMRLGGDLARSGVDQVMLFDRKRALRIHYVGGNLLFPQPGKH
jgi:hypothetical protein